LDQKGGSMGLIGNYGEQSFTDSGKLLWRGTTKFPWLRLHLDAPLLRDDLEDVALLLDHFLELGVVSTVGLLEKLQRGYSVVAEDTERLRENEEA
jgi:hypothetical protein